MSENNFIIKHMKDFIESTQFDVVPSCDDDFLDFDISCSPQKGFAKIRFMDVQIELPHEWSYKSLKLDLSEAKHTPIQGETSKNFFVEYTNWYQQAYGLPLATSVEDQSVINMKSALRTKLIESYIENANIIEVDIVSDHFAPNSTDDRGNNKNWYKPVVEIGDSSIQLQIAYHRLETGFIIDKATVFTDFVENNPAVLSVVKDHLESDFRFKDLNEKDMEMESKKYIDNIFIPKILTHAIQVDKYICNQKSLLEEKVEESKLSKKKKSTSLGFN